MTQNCQMRYQWGWIGVLVIALMIFSFLFSRTRILLITVRIFLNRTMLSTVYSNRGLLFHGAIFYLNVQPFKRYKS